MIKLLLFISFLVIFGLLQMFAFVWSKSFFSKIRKINFLENELIILISYIFFFASIFIIGRFINVQFFLISIIAANIGLILTIIVWNIIGNPKSPFMETAMWAGSDIGMKNSWLPTTTFILSTIFLIAYPIIIGINYFSLTSNEEIQIMILKYSSIYILINYILNLPMIIGVLASSFIDEDTRARSFLNQFGGLIANSLFISLLFWIFNKETLVGSFPLGNINLVYSPKLLMILMGYLFIFLVLPYFIGIQRAKHLKKNILESETSLLSKIISEINLSTDTNLMSKIEDIENEIAHKYRTFVDSDEGVAMGIELDDIENENDDDILAAKALIFQWYEIARPYDTRFKYYDFLIDTYSEITQFKESLENEQLNKKDKVGLCNKYLEHFKRKENTKENGEKGKTNPALWIGILVILSPLTSQILSEIGKYLIEIFKNM